MASRYTDRIRIVKEILGGVDYFKEGSGPNGPWYWSDGIRVTRVQNTIVVARRDSDDPVATTSVSEIVPDTDTPPAVTAETVLYGWLSQKDDMHSAE